MTASQVLSELRQAMAKYANVYRTGENLQRLLGQLKALEQRFCPLQHQAFHGIEIYNALKTAQFVVRSMEARTESRGSHYRADYPAKDPTTYVLKVTKKGIEKIIL